MESRYTLSLLLILLSFLPLDGRHILGGSVAYKVVSHDLATTSLDIDFILIRDQMGGGANFDSQAEFGIYGVKNNVYTYLQSEMHSPQNIESLNLEYSADCPELFYEQGVYSFNISLPNTSFDYYVIGHQRCCRTSNISNIINPGETGFALSITIYPKAFEYTDRANPLSPLSIPFLLNSQEEHEVDLSIDDIYIKEYRLTRPAVAGGISGVNFGDPNACDGITPDPQNCRPPYALAEYADETHPYGVESDANLDKVFGELKVTIPAVGIILFEMTVDRYMEDELLSSTNSQWTTTSSTCTMPLSTNVDSSCKEINLTPNPAYHTIRTSCLLTDIVVFDVLGRQVMLLDKMEANEGVSIVALDIGIYTLRGKSENGNLIELQFVKSGL